MFKHSGRWLGLALLLLPARAALADTLLVPSAYATIQAAVDSARDVDTIEVASGTYVESVQVSLKKNLTLDGTHQATIQSPAGQPSLSLSLCDGCVVEKF